MTPRVLAIWMGLALVQPGCRANDGLRGTPPPAGDFDVPGGDATVPAGDETVAAGDDALPAPGDDAMAPTGDAAVPAGDSAAPPAGDSTPSGDRDGPLCQESLGPSTDITAAIHHANIIDAILSAHCEWIVGCTNAGDWGPTFPDVPTCVAYFHAVDPSQFSWYPIKPLWPHLWGLSDATLWTIDSDAAELCLDSMRTNTCEREFDPMLDANCVAATTGRLQPGACCDFRGGCAATETCSVLVHENPGEIGRCRPPVEIGQPCDYFGTPCVDGAHCTNAGVCAADLDPGEACGTYTQNDMVTQKKCGELRCAVDVCVGTLKVGDGCSVHPECPPASHCLDIDGNGKRCIADSITETDCYDTNLGFVGYPQCANGYAYHSSCAFSTTGKCMPNVTTLGATCNALSGPDCGPQWLLQCSVPFFEGTCIPTPGNGTGCLPGMPNCPAGEYCGPAPAGFGACTSLSNRPMCEECL